MINYIMSVFKENPFCFGTREIFVNIQILNLGTRLYFHDHPTIYHYFDHVLLLLLLLLFLAGWRTKAGVRIFTYYYIMFNNQ